jgi:hypothetical protein
VRTIVKDGRVLIPVDPDPAGQRLFERLRAWIVYDASTRTVSVSFGEAVPVSRIVVTSAVAGSAQLTVSTRTGKGPSAPVGPPALATRPLAVGPQIIAGTVFAPLRVFAESAGAYVEWSARKRTVVIRKLPPSAAELQAENEARKAILDVGARRKQQLEDAAKNLK